MAPLERFVINRYLRRIDTAPIFVKVKFFCRLRIDCPHSCIKVARAGGTIIRLMMEIHAKTARNPIDFWTGTFRPDAKALVRILKLRYRFLTKDRQNELSVFIGCAINESP